MNRAYQKASSLLLSAMIMSSVHGMESNNIAEGTTEQVASVVWYKKGSVQIAAIATTVLALCAVAVYKGKVAVPAFVAGLCAATVINEPKIQASIPESNVIDNDSQKIEPISVEQNQNQVEKKGFEIKGFKVEVNTGVVNDLKKTVKDFMKNSKLVTWDDYKGGIEEVTEKISQPNADLIR